MDRKGSNLHSYPILQHCFPSMCWYLNSIFSIETKIKLNIIIVPKLSFFARITRGKCLEITFFVQTHESLTLDI